MQGLPEGFWGIEIKGSMFSTVPVRAVGFGVWVESLGDRSLAFRGLEIRVSIRDAISGSATVAMKVIWGFV